MIRLVLDCSVAMAWCFEDQQSAYSEAVLDILADGEAMVPEIWKLEVTNVLVVAERRRRLTPRRTAEFPALLSALPIAVDSSSAERAFSEVLHLARRYRLSSYDAAYLDLSMRRGWPLATLDDDLCRAARSAGAEVFAQR